jgi:AraC-like DNA-binding protein
MREQMNTQNDSALSDYYSSTSVAHSAIVTWHYKPELAKSTRVIPDGCIDFIISHDDQTDSGYGWMLSELSTSTYQVDAQAGELMRGIRLKAGVSIDAKQLHNYLNGHSPQSLLEKDSIDEFCLHSAAVTSALQCLASGVESIAKGASELGVSTRTLQRLIMSNTGRPPSFWLSLARARNAARALDQYDRLVDVAAAYNYSDQAHLSRDMQRWFGTTPNRLRADSELKALLAEPGYS